MHTALRGAHTALGAIAAGHPPRASVQPAGALSRTEPNRTEPNRTASHIAQRLPRHHTSLGVCLVEQPHHLRPSHPASARRRGREAPRRRRGRGTSRRAPAGSGAFHTKENDKTTKRQIGAAGRGRGHGGTPSPTRAGRPLRPGTSRGDLRTDSRRTAETATTAPPRARQREARGTEAQAQAHSQTQAQGQGQARAGKEAHISQIKSNQIS